MLLSNPRSGETLTSQISMLRERQRTSDIWSHLSDFSIPYKSDLYIVINVNILIGTGMLRVD